MATAKRELILAALATRLDAVRNPYPADYDKSPLTTLIEGDETVSDREYSDILVSMPISVERIAEYGENDKRETVANAMLAEAITMTLGNDLTLGGLCEDIRYTAGATVFSDTGSALVGAVARFDVIYRQAAGSPY